MSADEALNFSDAGASPSAWAHWVCSGGEGRGRPPAVSHGRPDQIKLQAKTSITTVTAITRVTCAGAL